MRIAARRDPSQLGAGKPVRTSTPGIDVIRYRDGRLRYKARISIGATQHHAYCETMDEARAWLDERRPAQAEARVVRAQWRATVVDEDEVTRLVRMLGWSDERRRECFAAPIEDDPIYEVGLELQRILGRDLTLEEVGTLYGVTRERVRQVQVEALRRIRVGHETRDVVRPWLEHIEDILATRGADPTDYAMEAA